MSQHEMKAGEYLAIGRIAGVHGIRGEAKVELLTDYPERFHPGALVYVGSETAAHQEEIESVRPHKGYLLVKFRSVPDRNAADGLRDRLVLIPEAEAMPLGADENYVHDLIGLRVETSDGQVLGELTEIMYGTANDVYVVRGQAGEWLLPALRDVVVSVDLASKLMVVVVPDGLEAQ